MASKQRRVAFNRYAIADPAALAALVKHMSDAAGGGNVLAELGGLDPGQLSRLAKGRMHELEPATYKALYRVCGLAAEAMVEKGELATEAHSAIRTTWERRLNAAVCEPAGGQSNTPGKPRGVGDNRIAIADPAALAILVEELSRAAGDSWELGKLGGMNSGQLFQLTKGQMHELDPATYNALYRVCGLAAEVMGIRDGLATDAQSAIRTTWERWLDAAVCEPAGGQSKTPGKPCRVGNNRIAIVYRAAVAAVVRDMSEAAGSGRKLAERGELDSSQISRLSNGEVHRIAPATYNALYRLCAPAARELAPKDRLAKVVDWKRRLDAAVTRPVDRADPPPPNPGPVLSFDRAIENPGPQLVAFLERVARKDQMAPIPDAWPRNEWVRVTKQVAAALGARGMLTMTTTQPWVRLHNTLAALEVRGLGTIQPKAGEVGAHYVLYLESLGLPRPT